MVAPKARRFIQSKSASMRNSLIHKMNQSNTPAIRLHTTPRAIKKSFPDYPRKITPELLNHPEFDRMVERAVVRYKGMMALSGYSMEDVIQETKLRVFTQWEKYAPSRGKFRFFVYSIALNFVRNMTHNRVSRSPKKIAYQSEYDASSNERTPFEIAVERENHTILKKELDSFSPLVRDVIYSHVLDGESISAISRRLNVPRDKIASLYHRAIVKLRLGPSKKVA